MTKQEFAVKIGTGVKKVGKFIDKTFVQPTKNYNKAQKTKDQLMESENISGNYNK